jgi:hypothetical protein
MATVTFVNQEPELDPVRHGDVIGLRFIPKTNTSLETWCNESKDSLLKIINSNSIEPLYARLRKYREEFGPVNLAYGEHTGHVHTVLPGDAAIGKGVGNDNSPSQGINASNFPTSILNEMTFVPLKNGTTFNFNTKTVLSPVLVVAVKPFGLYHISTNGKSTISFDVESLKESDMADHNSILCDAGNWLFGIQATVDLQGKLARVAD